MGIEKFCLIPLRVTTAIMGFLAIAIAYTMRICLSMAITELVIPRNHTSAPGTAVCHRYGEEESVATVKAAQRFEWSEELQGFILGSFYIGYIITHVPGGYLADKFGAKWTLSLGILMSSVFTLLTPLAIISGGPTALIVLRILIGCGQGTTFPALSTLLSKWVPVSERGKLGTLVLGGGQVGTIVSNSVSGFLMEAYDWDSVFYVFGVLGLSWFIVFTVLCYSDPREHPCISKKELDYLAAELDHARQKKEKDNPTPWLAIMKNAPMLAVISAQIGHDWGFYIMVTDLPKYMANVMSFSIRDNGILSSLPSVLMWILSITSGFIADWLITRHILTITTTRKLMTGLAAFLPAIFIVMASYAGCNHVLVVILFILCMGFMGTWYAGMKLSPLDMSPNYAGTLMAITNGIGALTGVFAPWSVGLMTPNATLMEWRLVFWVAFFVLFLTTIVYCIWASGEVQPFDDPETQKAYEEEKRARRQRAE